MRYLCSVALLTASTLMACNKGEPQHQAADSVAVVPAPPATPSTTTPSTAAPSVTSPPVASPPPPPVPAAPHAGDTAPVKHSPHATQPVTKSIGALKYIDVKVGTGEVAKPGMQVMVLYKGKLLNGMTFDSTADRDNPFVFQLGAGRVIQGWDMGIAGMRVGGKRHLVIPPELGYGDQANDPIPANSTLIFDVELIGVKPST